MASTISSFLVSIGTQFDDKGAKEAKSGLDSIKSSALQVGTVLAGAFGLKKLTSDFANANDELGKFSDTFGLLPGDVAALGTALEHEGGTLESMVSQLSNLEKVRAGLLAGNAAIFEATGKVGINASQIIAAKDATEAYIGLARQFESMNQQQRLNAADALGFDEASIRLLSKGETEVRAILAEMQKMRPITKEMTEISADWNDENLKLQTNLGGMADRISNGILPPLTGVVAGMNDWIGANREFINSGIDESLALVADNFGLIATAGGLLAGSGVLKTLGSMAKIIPGIGAGLATAAGALASIAGVGGAAAGGWVIGGELDKLLREQLGPQAYGQAVDLVFGSAEKAAGFVSRNASAAAEFIMTPATTISDPRFAGGILDRGQSYNPYTDRPIVIENKVILDGQVIDERIIRVDEQQNQQALSDLTSSNGG